MGQPSAANPRSTVDPRSIARFNTAFFIASPFFAQPWIRDPGVRPKPKLPALKLSAEPRHRHWPEEVSKPRASDKAGIPRASWK